MSQDFALPVSGSYSQCSVESFFCTSFEIRLPVFVLNSVCSFDLSAFVLYSDFPCSFYPSSLVLSSYFPFSFWLSELFALPFSSVISRDPSNPSFIFGCSFAVEQEASCMSLKASSCRLKELSLVLSETAVLKDS